MSIGVCVSCANSDYTPKSDGVQYRDSTGRFITTEGHYTGKMLR